MHLTKALLLSKDKLAPENKKNKMNLSISIPFTIHQGKLFMI